MPVLFCTSLLKLDHQIQPYQNVLHDSFVFCPRLAGMILYDLSFLFIFLFYKNKGRSILIMVRCNYYASNTPYANFCQAQVITNSGHDDMIVRSFPPAKHTHIFVDFFQA